LSCPGNVIRSYILPAPLYFARNSKQSFHLAGNGGGCVALFDLRNQFIIGIASAEVLGCNGTVTALAEQTIVLRRNICRDHLAFRESKRVRPGQQYLGKIVEWLCGFRTKEHWTA